MTTCKNCGHKNNGKYCVECGQLLNTERITFTYLVKEALHVFTHIEKGILYTLKELAIRPGKMQAEYLNGNRARHSKPFATFFIAGTVTALLLYLIDRPDDAGTHLNEAREHFIRHFYVFLQLSLLPFYALVTWLFFRNHKINYAEALVLFTYALAFMLLLVIAANLVHLVFGNIPAGLIEMPLLFIYLMLTCFGFFTAEPKWRVALKSLAIIVICYLVSNDISDQLVRRVM